MNIDKVKELYVGQEFKNYKIFCNFMDEEPKKANSKISQIKEWLNAHFLYHNAKKELADIIPNTILPLKDYHFGDMPKRDASRFIGYENRVAYNVCHPVIFML